MYSASEICRAIRSVAPQFKQHKTKSKQPRQTAQVSDFKKKLASLTPEQLAEVLALVTTE